jgi:hypothetical protein
MNYDDQVTVARDTADIANGKHQAAQSDCGHAWGANQKGRPMQGGL